VGIAQANVKGQIVIVLRERGKDRLYMVDAESGQMSELPDVSNVNSETAMAPTWSPDGERLAWMAQYKGKMHIIAMELAEGEPYQLASGEGYDQVSSPAWLPGSQQLSFLAVDSASNWFVTADAKTGEMVEKVELPGYRNLFAWNPAGGLIAFARRSSSVLDVVISSSPTTEDISLQTGGEEYAPAWSANGEAIAFQSDAGRSSGMNEIWIGRPDGSDLRPVTNTPEEFWSRAPTWSPDGRWIAYVSDQAGSRGRDYGELFVVELGTGRVVKLTNTGGNVYDWRPAWRP
jgi:Tol biopolymer transport system component